MLLCIVQHCFNTDKSSNIASTHAKALFVRRQREQHRFKTSSNTDSKQMTTLLQKRHQHCFKTDTIAASKETPSLLQKRHTITASKQTPSLLQKGHHHCFKRDTPSLLQKRHTITASKETHHHCLKTDNSIASKRDTITASKETPSLLQKDTITHRDLAPIQIDLAAACTDSGKLSRKCEYPP